MKIKSTGAKLVAALASLVLIVSGSVVASQQSNASGLPTIRVLTPAFNPANDTFASDGLGQYYAAGGRSYFKYVGAGSTITITYLVTSDGTAAAADKSVSFMVNAPTAVQKRFGKLMEKTSGHLKTLPLDTDFLFLVRLIQREKFPLQLRI